MLGFHTLVIPHYYYLAIMTVNVQKQVNEQPFELRCGWHEKQDWDGHSAVVRIHHTIPSPSKSMTQALFCCNHVHTMCLSNTTAS